MFLDRSRRAGPHLEWKVRAFTLGAVLGLAGIYLEEGWMTGAAIVVLSLAVLLRLRPGGEDEDDEEEEGDQDDVDGHEPPGAPPREGAPPE